METSEINTSQMRLCILVNAVEYGLHFCHSLLVGTRSISSKETLKCLDYTRPSSKIRVYMKIGESKSIVYHALFTNSQNSLLRPYKICYGVKVM